MWLLQTGYSSFVNMVNFRYDLLKCETPGLIYSHIHKIHIRELQDQRRADKTSI